MVRQTENSNAIYPLAPVSKGKRVLGKTDPNLRKAHAVAGLKALHGDGNVITVDDKNVVRELTTNMTGFIKTTSSIDVSPINFSSTNISSSTTSNATAVSIAPITSLASVSGSITLVPPTDLSVGGESVAAASDGSALINAVLNFTSADNALDYEIKIVSGEQIFNETVSILSQNVDGSKYLTVRWSYIPNADNYVFVLKNSSNQIVEEVLVFPSIGAGMITSVSHTTTSALSNGSYTYQIFTYNYNGLCAGTTTPQNVVVS